jgi:hypothetical protein
MQNRIYFTLIYTCTTNQSKKIKDVKSNTSEFLSVTVKFHLTKCPKIKNVFVYFQGHLIDEEGGTTDTATTENSLIK